MLFVGKIRCERKTHEAFFTSDGNHREYRLMHGDATSEPDPIESAFYIVAGRDGHTVAFDGEMNDIDGDAIRIETAVRPATDPPDINEGRGYIRDAVI